MAAEKGKEFSVEFCATSPLIGTERKAVVRVDGVRAKTYILKPHHHNRNKKCDGWSLEAQSVQYFCFGAVDTSEGRYSPLSFLPFHTIREQL